MGKYVEYKKARQEEFNNLPIWFAFNERQLEDELNKRGLTMDDLDKVCRTSRFFFLKSDKPVIKAFCEKDTKGELFKKISESKAFALDAFKYEMRACEYPINWQGDYDVCMNFGTCDYADDKTGEDYLREMGFGDHVIETWQQARKAVMKYDF